MECITVVEHMSFNLGNAIKYLWRAGKKGPSDEDLRKAVWYIERERKRLEYSTRQGQREADFATTGEKKESEKKESETETNAYDYFEGKWVCGCPYEVHAALGQHAARDARRCAAAAKWPPSRSGGEHPDARPARGPRA